MYFFHPKNLKILLFPCKSSPPRLKARGTFERVMNGQKISQMKLCDNMKQKVSFEGLKVNKILLINKFQKFQLVCHFVCVLPKSILKTPHRKSRITCIDFAQKFVVMGYVTCSILVENFPFKFKARLKKDRRYLLRYPRRIHHRRIQSR